jgi:hypothetical protein
MADTIAQWHNAGGMVQFYDFPLEEYINVCFLHPFVFFVPFRDANSFRQLSV